MRASILCMGSFKKGGLKNRERKTKVRVQSPATGEHMAFVGLRGSVFYSGGASDSTGRFFILAVPVTTVFYSGGASDNRFLFWRCQ